MKKRILILLGILIIGGGAAAGAAVQDISGIPRAGGAEPDRGPAPGAGVLGQHALLEYLLPGSGVSGEVLPSQQPQTV